MTIYALSSGPGISGVAVIRISGTDTSNVIKLLNNPNKKFDGIDGNFYFKDNMIERDLNILKINNGNSFVIN